MARRRLDKMALIQKLPRLQREKSASQEQDRFDQASLANALLMLAEISHETEYVLCRSLTEHLLGQVPEPDDADLGEE